MLPSSPFKAESVSRQRSTSPLPPPPVPAKAIDLNSSTRSTDKETGAKIIKRAFLCDIILKGEGEETTSLLQHLGRALPPLTTIPTPPLLSVSRPVTPSRGDSDSDDASLWIQEKRVEMSNRLSSLIEELVRTERSYLSRLQALKKNYADPLRSFARQEYTKIVPMYEAKTLFTNIDTIIPAAVAFLRDLEVMFAAGNGETVVGDICLKHLKDLHTFDPYRAYISKQDESQKTLQEALKKYSSFGSFIERTKYQTTGIGNIGLRELLMEPVQRIPRYTLLWQSMIKAMPPLSQQRTKLVEAISIASRIAKCEPDAQTIRATVMYCLERNVEGFPANLFSNNRDFIDSIDVEDIPVEYPTAPSRPMSVTSTNSIPSLASFGSSASSSQLPTSPQSHLSSLPCTLFLFDDKIMIVKRQSSSVSGRKVTGLDDVQKLVKTGGGVAILDKQGAKKDKLAYRGIVNVLDIDAVDVGNGDFHLFFENCPTDQGDRWSGRPFRSYSTVQPPFGITMDPVANKRDKLRFIDNLWAAQAQARAKMSPAPRVIKSHEEVGLEQAGDMFGRAKLYFSVWDTDGWSQNLQKAKIAIHIDEDGSTPELPVLESNPSIVIRLHPMTGSLCRFSTPGSARVVIDFKEVNGMIASTIHRHSTFPAACPTTPSSTSHRLRPSMLNLDMISRNLFGHGSMNTRGQSSDLFSPATQRRKSNISRTSTMNTGRSTTSNESRLSSPPSDIEIAARPPPARGMGQSEIDLNERLNLARKNSKTMNALSPAASRLAAKSVAELRSGDLEPRPASRLVTKSVGDLRHADATPPDTSRSRSPVAVSPAPFALNSATDPPNLDAIMAQSFNPGLPRGPPILNSPLITSPRQLPPPPLSPRPQGPRSPGPPNAPLSPLARALPIAPGLGSAHTKLRRVSQTQPLSNSPPGDPSHNILSKRQHSGDQLSPRKRSPTRSPLHPNPSDPDSRIPNPLRIPSGRRRVSDRNSTRRSSGPLTEVRVRQSSVASNATGTTADDVFMTEHASTLSAVSAAKRNVMEARASVKRLKAEVQSIRKQLSRESAKSSTYTPSSLPRSPHRRNIKRLADNAGSTYDDLSVTSRMAHNGKHELDILLLDENTRGLTAIAEKLEGSLRVALADSEQAEIQAERLTLERAEHAEELRKWVAQTTRAKETTDLLRQQLADTQVEVDVIYEAFNTELDGMFHDTQLPSTEAFDSMRRDLQLTKAKRNELALENMKLKRDLQEANLKREQWAKILRERGVL